MDCLLNLSGEKCMLLKSLIQPSGLKKKCALSIHFPLVRQPPFFKFQFSSPFEENVVFSTKLYYICSQST